MPRSTKRSDVAPHTTVPSELGYRMPAEWELHIATWIAWPHFKGDWPGKFEPIPWVYAEIIRSLAKHERVELIVNHVAAGRQARRFLKRADALSENIGFHSWPTDRVWLRDSGCIFLKWSARDPVGEHPSAQQFHAAVSYLVDKARELTGGSQKSEKKQPRPSETSLALKFHFNAWAKYSNWRRDERIGSLMAKAAHAQQIHPTSLGKRIVLEGGSIDVNGAGTILTTEECLLSKQQQRNPHMARIHYEKAFADYLGAPHTIWLGRGILGDDTHGHVDDLTRFVAKSTVVTMVEPNSRDVNHAPLRANLRRLQSARDQDGRQLTIVELPMPQPVIFEGRHLPASYANFYIANGVVLVPVFNRANDRVALETLAQLFPTREIVPIYSGDFIWGFGAMHCMTQQQPA
jgi:agmatine deiminase